MTILNSTKNKVNNSSVGLFNPQKRDRKGLPWLVYLPGMDGTGKLFNTQMAQLTSKFNLRCLAISPKDLSNWQQLTRATINCLVRELLKDNPDSIYLCGESFGGCLAMAVAVTAPKLISGMTLINAASSFNEQPILGLGINLTRWMPQWIHQNSAVGLLPFLAELSRINYSDRKDLLKAMQSLSQEVVSWRLSLLRDFRLTPRQCSRFKKPALIVAGGCDRLLPSKKEASKLLKLFPNSTVEILPNSGHACLLEKEINLAEIFAKHQFAEKQNFACC